MGHVCIFTIQQRRLRSGQFQVSTVTSVDVISTSLSLISYLKKLSIRTHHLTDKTILQGRTGVFHGTLALIIIPWLITLFFYIFRFSGWCIENKSVNSLIQRGGLLAQNVICLILMLIAGILLSQNMGKFDFGDVSIFRYRLIWQIISQLSYGSWQNNRDFSREYESQRGSGPGSPSFGNCKGFNTLDPYCQMYPDECRKFFDECMKFGTGQQSEYLDWYFRSLKFYIR